jgi:hypothetical protein
MGESKRGGSTIKYNKESLWEERETKREFWVTEKEDIQDIRKCSTN